MRRALLTAFIASAVALIFLCLPAGALAALVPTVTLTSPAQNAVITGGQPTFSGSASNGPASPVTVSVYAGSSVNPSALLQAPTATPSADGSYSVGPTFPLADGNYTAQAEQDNLLLRGLSPPVTFTVHNALPQVTLNSPGTAPLLTSTPALSGNAGTAFGDSSTVGLTVYPGADTSRTPVESLVGALSPQAQFTIQISPGLPDGQYTALATQQGVAGAGMSAPQTFRIKANAPAVTLENPPVGSRTTDVEPLFSGVAGNVPGDSARVKLALYSGAGTHGQPIETVNVTRSGSSWSQRWPTPLARGRYTAQATQSDDVGHTGFSAPHTFQVVAAPNVIGSSVKLSHGTVSVSVRCGLAPGMQCAGDVLILTVRNFRPVPSGPAGRLRVMFAYVSIAGGKTALVSRHVPGRVARALRRAGKIKVKVSTTLSTPGGSPQTESAIRRLRRRS